MNGVNDTYIADITFVCSKSVKVQDQVTPNI